MPLQWILLSKTDIALLPHIFTYIFTTAVDLAIGGLDGLHIVVTYHVSVSRQYYVMHIYFVPFRF